MTAQRTKTKTLYNVNEVKNYGVNVGDFIILPQVSVGALYNGNVWASKTNTVDGWGVGIQPGITIKRFNGIHDTTVTLFGNIQTYFNVSSADVFTGGISLRHVYEIERGFTVTLQGGAQQVQDLQSAYGAVGIGSGASGVHVEPITYMNYSTSLDIKKNFNDAFINGGLAFQDYNYQDAQTTTGIKLPQGQRDVSEYSGYVRGGLRLYADCYIFLQPQLTQYQFAAGMPDATGYTITTGIGTDRLGLFSGEMFGGYQLVSNGSGHNGANGNSNPSGATFGGNVSWTPTRDLVATLTAFQAFTPTTILSGSVGSITKTNSVSLNVAYNYSTKIILHASAGYSNVNYSPNTRDDKLSQSSVDGTYYLRDSVGLRLQYSFTNVNSNQSVYDYDRNLVILSANLRL